MNAESVGNKEDFDVRRRVLILLMEKRIGVARFYSV